MSTDRDALVALYNATHGANWRDRRNWNTDAPLGQWYGVHVNDAGRVVKLILDSNNLKGPIPPEIGNLGALTWLSLRNNQLSGPIPKELGALSELQRLSLGFNKLSGNIPPELGKLTALTILNLRRNQLTGHIPPELGALSELRALGLNSNKLTGHIPRQLGQLGALQCLALYSNKLDGPIPKELGALSELQVLGLNDNELSGPLPPELGNLGALTLLRLDSNQLSGHIPPELGALSELRVLWLSSNKLTGHIPPQLGQLGALQHLLLFANKLDGPIPPELGKLTALEQLYLNQNQLSGPIPKELGALSELQVLQLECNELSGHIPHQLGQLGALEYLSLSHNKLDGHIPPQLGQLGALQSLYLSGNKLDGGPWENETLGAWKTRLQSEFAHQKRVEQERAEQERRAEQHATLERQRVEELERQDMMRKAGDIGRWFHQDLGFDENSSACFGASLRAHNLGNPKAILAMDKQTLEGVLGQVEMPSLLTSLVMEAWRRRLKGDEDRRRVEAETTLIEARQRAESAAEERRRQEEAERTKKDLQEAEALRREKDAAAKAEAERQRSKKAALEEAALRQEQALHTPIGRWLKLEAHFNNTQASRFCADLQELGISSTHALQVLKQELHQQLALDLGMNKYETEIFLAAMDALRSKPDAFDVPSSTANAGSSFVNLMQLRDCGGMATVFTANQLIGGPESTATRPVVLKRSDKDQPAAYCRESRILQYLSRPGGAAAGYVIQLLEAYSTPEFNFIAMEQGSQNLTAQIEESKRLPPSERIHRLALWGQQACQVLVALHDLGVVWGDVKPDNFVFRRDRLVAVDFGSTCVEAGSAAQQELGAHADTSFTSSPSDQFAWSVQYAAPERAKYDRLGGSCVARRSQDVWSLGMVLYYLATGGTPYFPSPVERTEEAIAQFREQTQQTLTNDNFRADLKKVRGSAWRCSIGLALVTRVDERGTASEVLEAFTRGIRGLVSTVSKTRGIESLKRMLAVISEDQQEVLRRTGTISGNVDRVLQEQLDLRHRVAAMSTVLEQLAMDEMRMPHTFLVLPEQRSRLRRPKQWFADRGRLFFICAHGLELAPCGEDGTGFLVSQPKEWMKKHATLLQVAVMTILAAAAVAGTVASGGAMGPIAASLALPFEVINLDEAYSFLSGAGGEEMDRLLEDISDTLDPTKGDVGVPTNLQRVKEVTGAEYRSVLNYLDTKCRGWDRQMGGMERTLSADGVIGWVCPEHRSEWKGASVKATPASACASSPIRPMPAETATASSCNCLIS